MTQTMFHVEHLNEQVFKGHKKRVGVSVLGGKFSRRWLVTTTISLVTLVSVGCSRPNPTPELIDPIYKDLNERSSLAKAAAESAKEELAQLKIDVAALPPRDPTLRKLKEDVSKKELQMMVAEQEGLYFEVRASQRRDYARKEYLKAFNKGEPWPDPKHFEAYEAQRRLKDAPREWSNRIEKTNRYNRKSADDMRKEIEEKLKAAPAAGG